MAIPFWFNSCWQCILLTSTASWFTQNLRRIKGSVLVERQNFWCKSANRANCCNLNLMTLLSSHLSLSKKISKQCFHLWQDLVWSTPFVSEPDLFACLVESGRGEAGKFTQPLWLPSRAKPYRIVCRRSGKIRNDRNIIGCSFYFPFAISPSEIKIVGFFECIPHPVDGLLQNLFHKV